MSKYRIYELAKEFNTTSKVVLDILARNNHATAKNHMSSVGDEEKSIIQHVFAGNKKDAAPQAATKPPVQQKTSSENNDQRKNAMNTTNRPKTENKSGSNRAGGHTANTNTNRPAGQRPNKPADGQARPQQQHNRPNTNTNQTHQTHATSGNRTGTSTGNSRPATNNSTTAPNRSNAAKPRTGHRVRQDAPLASPSDEPKRRTTVKRGSTSNKGTLNAHEPALPRRSTGDCSQ